jgi:hypothetical protein
MFYYFFIARFHSYIPPELTPFFSLSLLRKEGEFTNI